MDYLVHHGIKGQRWGVRRYQNEDGSYTEAGKKRRGLKIAGAVLGGGVIGAAIYANRQKIADKAKNATKEELLVTKGGLNQSRGSLDQVRSTVRNQADAAAKRKALEDAKNMTDDELKARISRLNLENNYVNAINQQQVAEGSDAVDRILAITGAALGVAATGVGIWASIAGMKK